MLLISAFSPERICLHLYLLESAGVYGSRVWYRYSFTEVNLGHWRMRQWGFPSKQWIWASRNKTGIILPCMYMLMQTSASSVQTTIIREGFLFTEILATPFVLLSYQNDYRCYSYSESLVELCAYNGEFIRDARKMEKKANLLAITDDPCKTERWIARRECGKDDFVTNSNQIWSNIIYSTR